MDDTTAPPVGTKSPVTEAYDIGNILADWNNGSSLSVVPKVNRIRKVMVSNE